MLGAATYPSLLLAYGALRLAAPHGTSCPEQEDVREALARIGFDDTEATITASWIAEGDAIRVRVARETGSVDIVRLLDTPRCEERAQAIAFIIERVAASLPGGRAQAATGPAPSPWRRPDAHEPAAAEARKRDAPEPEPEPEPGENQRVRTNDEGPVGAVRTVGGQAPEAPGAWQIEARAGPLLSLGSRVAPGGALGAELRHTSSPFGGTLLLAGIPGVSYGQSTVGMQLDTWLLCGGVVARLFTLDRFEGGASLSALLAYVSGRPTGLAQNAATSGFYPGGRLGAHMAYRLSSHLELRLDAGARTSSEPSVYVARPSVELARLPVVEGDLLVGLGFLSGDL